MPPSRCMTVTGMDGVVNCRTTYTQLSNQQICNLEITETLAVTFESCNRVLNDPVSHLTFKRRSDDNDGTIVDPQHDNVTELPVKQKFPS